MLVSVQRAGALCRKQLFSRTQWDAAHGLAKGGTKSKRTALQPLRCTECVQSTLDLTQFYTNQADESRRTCNVCKAILPSRQKLFAHMEQLGHKASQRIGDQIDNTDARESVESSSLTEVRCEPGVVPIAIVQAK